MKARSLQDLRPLRQALQDQREREQALAAERLARQRQAEAEQALFVRAVGAVQPLPDRAWVTPTRPAPAPVARQRALDEAAVLRDALSDGFDASSLLDTDEALSFARPGMGPDVVRKLREGRWSVQRELDLHGLRSDQARAALSAFVRDAHRQGLRCVRVVHGKGLGSPGREPVLKHKVHSWLVQKNQVLAFVQARPAQGGAGALLVLLAPAGP